MKFGKWGAAAVVLAVCTLVMIDWAQGWRIAGMVPKALDRRPVLTLWYTDEAMKDYLTKAAYEYTKKQDVRVTPVYKNGLEYLEAVNSASVSNEDMPDLYIVSNDALEKAALAGLAVPIDESNSILTRDHFSATALQAVTWHGNKLAYPFYFETTALLYNKDYVFRAAEQIGQSPEDILPKTISDVLTFADGYEAPENVEAVFRWDVSDIFYNYFFAGDEIDVGGVYGDDESSINIYNEKSVQGLLAYQILNQFFSIDARTSSYDAVIQDFMDGKLVFTVATSDALERISIAKKEEACSVNYGVVKLPNINEKIASKSLSVTGAVAINGYSTKQQYANEFAAWLTSTGASELYRYTGHIPAYRHALPDVEGAEIFYQEYEESVPVPKMMSAANFWVQMEIAYTRIWNGEDVSVVLKELDERIKAQVVQSDQ